MTRHKEGVAPEEKGHPEDSTQNAAQKEKSDESVYSTFIRDGIEPSQENIRDFLRDYISYAIHLVAIKPDADPDKPEDTQGRHFNDDHDAAASWAVRMNRAGFNVYWSVNVVPTGMNKKPKKSDISAMRFAHLDLDRPKDGSDWSKADKLSELQALQFPPSFVVDSGNGLGAFWRLDEEVPSWN